MDWEKDDASVKKLHPTQKPLKLLERLIDIFTDEGDVVIDPVAGSGSTLIAALNKKRKAYGFEIKKNFFKDADNWIKERQLELKEIEEYGYAKTAAAKEYPIIDFPTT